MIIFVDVTKENIKEFSTNSPQILDHLYRMLIIGDFGSRRINLLLNLIN